MTLADLPAGSDTVLACYQGDSNNNTSSGTIAQTVNTATLTVMDNDDGVPGSQQSVALTGAGLSTIAGTSL